MDTVPVAGPTAPGLNWRVKDDGLAGAILAVGLATTLKPVPVTETIGEPVRLRLLLPNVLIVRILVMGVPTLVAPRFTVLLRGKSVAPSSNWISGGA